MMAEKEEIIHKATSQRQILMAEEAQRSIVSGAGVHLVRIYA